MSEHPKVAAARAAAAAARAISAEAAAAAARADADAAAAAVDAAEADVAATEAAVRHRAKRMRALDWEAIVGIYDGDGNSALDPGEFVEVIYDALRMTGPLTHDGAIQIAATIASSFWGGDGTMARVDASTLRKAAAAGVFSCIEPPRPSPFAFETSGDSSSAHFAAFMSAALRKRIKCEPNSVSYSLPRSERTAGPGPSWGEGGVAVPLEPPVRSGVHEIVFNVRSDPRKFVVSAAAVTTEPQLRSRSLTADAQSRMLSCPPNMMAGYRLHLYRHTASHTCAMAKPPTATCAWRLVAASQRWPHLSK